MATKKAEPTPAELNGQPETFTLELEGVEINLLHQILTQVSFPTVAAKQISASVQGKIEALVPQE